MAGRQCGHQKQLAKCTYRSNDHSKNLIMSSQDILQKCPEKYRRDMSDLNHEITGRKNSTGVKNIYNLVIINAFFACETSEI